MVTKEFVASIIDHTLLKPESTPDEIKKYAERQWIINLHRYV